MVLLGSCLKEGGEKLCRRKLQPGKRRVRICERNTSAAIQLSEGGESVLGAGAEIPPQPMVAAVHVHSGADIHCKPWRAPCHSRLMWAVIP